MIVLEHELQELKTRVERLEAMGHRLIDNEPSQVALPPPSTPLEQEQLLAWLQSQGLVRHPTPEEQRLAAEWDTLTEEKKQTHIRFMQSLSLTPPLSQIILERRHEP